MKTYIIGAALSLGMLVSPVLALAQVQGDVAPDTNQSSCINLQYNLQYRSTGTEVSRLQDFLQSKGYLNSEPTGYFGLLTTAAVRSFQSASGILNSGYVGPITRARINNVSCGGTTSTTPTTQTNSNLPAGCLAGYLYSPLTGQRCVTVAAQTNYPSGCSSTVGYSSTTGKKCDGTTLTPISTISCGNGDDYYDGGEGTDTLTYFGKRSDFVITKNANGSYTFKDTVPCRADTDTVINMELFRFADGLYTLQDLFSVTGTNVQTNSVVINSFAASPTTINTGQAVMFTWSSNLSQNDISVYGGGCSIEGMTQNNVALNVTPGLTSASSQITFVPPATATYTLFCTSGGKDVSPSATRRITVNVGQPQTNPVVISSFTASPTSVTSGQPVTFSWGSNLTNNDTTVYGGGCGISALTYANQQIHITAGFAGGGASGSITYAPTLTATYTLTCSAGAKDGSPMDTEQVIVAIKG